MPAEVFTANSDGADVRQITHQNGALLSQLELPAPEPIWFAGAENTQVEGLLLRPPHFDASKKYPLLLLIHGGPQGEWDDAWSYRWNPQVMAAPGYVALMINPRGSFGYGEKFTQEISRDWGGKVYDGPDERRGRRTGEILVHRWLHAWRQPEGPTAATWSTGLPHTPAASNASSATPGRTTLSACTRPKSCGSRTGNTAERRGRIRRLYRKWSPSSFAGALGKYKTPTLVIGGELDFRVPYTQDLEFFSALQRQGVPSKLVIFPDEGHWVLKPQNSQLWYKTFLDWLAQYLK